MNRIEEIQQELVARGIDGWLFYDHHKRDRVPYDVLNISSDGFITRRWYYFIPAQGEPKKLVHAIEQQRLEDVPGDKFVYRRWQEISEHLSRFLEGGKTIAMQYSPLCNIPMVSNVDAGTVELVRSLGFEVVSSADLIQLFSATLSSEQLESHKRAGDKIIEIMKASFGLVKNHVRGGQKIFEHDVLDFILQEFESNGMTCEDLYPMVGANEHAADPHYEVPIGGPSLEIRDGDRLLLDIWARFKEKGSVYYDITWCANLGAQVDPTYAHYFETCVKARNEAKDAIVSRLSAGKEVRGWEIDDIARGIVEAQGLGEFFTHRTGHSITDEVHGPGGNIDNLETKDDRLLIPGLCFSIEPGIYNSPIGCRSEINVFIDHEGNATSYGEHQETLLIL